MTLRIVIMKALPVLSTGICALLLFLGPGQLHAADVATPVGLYIENGTLMKNGRAYHGIGANYIDLFSRTLEQPDNKTSFSNLTILARAEVPFVRFMCGGYWPANQRIYLTNRVAFFEKLDRVVRCAETNKIGLIPSLFWYYATVPDLFGEHIDQLGNPESKSIAHIREYTAEIVNRYRNSPAIWGWEFGNEYPLDCDLPNHADHRPPIQPALGTPSTRSERDEMEFAQLNVALKVFGETVRKFDPSRVIFTGNAAPRPAAWHNVNKNTWSLDSRAQFGEILLRDNPDPINSITVHLYSEANGIYPGASKSIDQCIAATTEVAKQGGKPLFLGEFGVSAELGSQKKQEAVFQEFLNAIQKHQVPLSAFWVFDFEPQAKTYSATFDGDRAFIFEALKRVNREWASKPSAR